MQFFEDINETRNELKRLISYEEEMVRADPTRDRVRAF